MFEFFYILVDGAVTPCINMMTWAQWFEHADRQIARTLVGSLDVSTIFLGLNHNFAGEGPPLLFETMVFGDPPANDDEASPVGITERYSTLEQARLGHELVVARVREHLGLDRQAAT